MYIMYAADEVANKDNFFLSLTPLRQAILIEMHPSYRQDRHFRHAARMSGKIYMPLRTQMRETCNGTSDNVQIPTDEFRRTLDGAMRIARFKSFTEEVFLYFALMKGHLMMDYLNAD